MQFRKNLLMATILGAATLATTPALAAAAEPVGTWYLGAGAGQSRGKIDDASVGAVLSGTGATATAITKNESTAMGKAFLGYQFNKYIAAEGGFFRLGQSSFDVTTTPAGTVHGELKNTIGWNFDAVGTLPIIADRFMLLGRVGIQSSKTSDLFSGTGAAAALRNPTPSKNLVSYKYGVGAEFDFTRNIGVRGEFERYRVSDGISGKLNVNTITASLLYRF